MWKRLLQKENMDSIDTMKFLQKELSQKIIRDDCFETPRLIGGLDVSHNLRDPSQTIYAAAVILNYPQLEVIEQTSFHEKQTLPYIPGFLGFREVPTLIKAIQQLGRVANYFG